MRTGRAPDKKHLRPGSLVEPGPALRPAAVATAPGRVRIIGGQYRRTPIPVVDVPGLRPTPDRVRETLFNWLEHQRGGFAGVSALDLFAGSGALGFEAASRGARRVVLVEHDGRAAEALQALQRRLGATAVEVIRSDWKAAALRQAPASFELVFLDPPFDSGLLTPALEAARRIVAPNGLIYAEAPRVPDPQGAAARAGLEVVRSGRAGSVAFELLRAPG